MKRITLLVLVLLSSCASAQSFKTPWHNTPLPTMIADADVICNVTVESSTEGKVVPLDIGVWHATTNKQFEIVELHVKCKVHQTLKGQPRNEFEFTTYAQHWKTKGLITFSGSPFPLPHFPVGEQCLIFLKESADGLTNPGNKWYNQIIVPADVWKSVKPGTPTEMVTQTLMLSLERRQPEAIGWLADMKDVNLIPDITPYLDSEFTGLAHDAMIALVRLNYLPAIKKLVEEVKKGGKLCLSYDDTSGNCYTDAWGDGHELEQVTDHTAIPIIVELLNSEENNIKLFAGRAIKNLATKDDFPLLLAMLDNSCFNVRYSAHVALHMLTNLSKWPAMDMFRSEESTYVTFWKDWAKTNGYKAAK